jgi:HK97 family phage portal protein
MAIRLTPSGGWANLGRTEDRALPAPTVEPTYTSWSTSAPLNVDTSNVLRVSDAYACVRLLADSISSLPLHAYRATAQGREAAGENARIVQLLQRPSPGSTGVDLVSQVVTHLQPFGECMLAKYQSDGEIVQLGLIHPEQVQVELRGQTIVYTLSTNKGQVEVGPSDVLHIKGLSVDGLRGLSPVAMCRTALGLASSLQRSAKVFTEQGSKPSGILTAPGTGGKEQLERLAAGWAQRHAGVENQHRVAVLSGDIAWTPIGFSQDDQQFLGQREFSTREIARCFRVPAWAVEGDSGSSLTYANVTEQARSLVVHSLRRGSSGSRRRSVVTRPCGLEERSLSFHSTVCCAEITRSALSSTRWRSATARIRAG